MIFKDKIDKKDFESKLIAMFEGNSLSKSPYRESGLEGEISMMLYYVDSVHCGTWCQGEGWIFDLPPDNG